MSAHDDALCAVDRAGGLYMCGPALFATPSHGGWVGALAALPAPPAPIRGITAGLPGCGLTDVNLAMHGGEPMPPVTVLGSDPNRLPGVVLASLTGCIWPLALLVDGSVWSMTGQVRLPIGVPIVTFAPHTFYRGRLEVVRPDRWRQSVDPAELFLQTT
jgi:hypothetical protein